MHIRNIALLPGHAEELIQMKEGMIVWYLHDQSALIDHNALASALSIEFFISFRGNT